MLKKLNLIDKDFQFELTKSKNNRSIKEQPDTSKNLYPKNARIACYKTSGKINKK